MEYSGTKKSKLCCHPPFHPPNFCRHSLKLLSPTLPKLVNWILLSLPPLSSDPDNPPKFGTCTLLVFFAFSFVVNSTESVFTFPLLSLRLCSPQERGGRGSQSHFDALNSSPERGHRRGRMNTLLYLTPVLLMKSDFTARFALAKSLILPYVLITQ